MRLRKFCRRSCQNCCKTSAKLAKSDFSTKLATELTSVQDLQPFLRLIISCSNSCERMADTVSKFSKLTAKLATCPKTTGILSAIPAIAFPAPQSAKPAPLTQNLLQILRLTHLCSSCSEAPCKFCIQHCKFCTVQYSAPFFCAFFINHTSQCAYGNRL